MSGVVVQVRPAPLPARPMGWVPRGHAPLRGSRWTGLVGDVPTWGIAGALIGFLFFAAGITATVATTSAAPPKPPSVACAPASSVAGLSAEQRQNATRIITVGRSLGVPERAQVVALATAMQESTLRNLGGPDRPDEDGGDRDSEGLFQQRPSQGWGTPAQVTDPVYASKKFYRALMKVPGWERMAVTKAAQTVQRSDYPDAYAKHQGVATALVGATKCERRS